MLKRKEWKEWKSRHEIANLIEQKVTNEINNAASDIPIQICVINAIATSWVFC